MTDKQYGVMKEFTGGDKIIAGDGNLYKKIMKISDGDYINTAPTFKAGFIMYMYMAQKKHQNMQMIQNQPNMTLPEVKGCFSIMW